MGGTLVVVTQIWLILVCMFWFCGQHWILVCMFLILWTTLDSGLRVFDLVNSGLHVYLRKVPCLCHLLHLLHRVQWFQPKIEMWKILLFFNCIQQATLERVDASCYSFVHSSICKYIAHVLCLLRKNPEQSSSSVVDQTAPVSWHWENNCFWNFEVGHTFFYLLKKTEILQTSETFSTVFNAIKTPTPRNQMMDSNRASSWRRVLPPNFDTTTLQKCFSNCGMISFFLLTYPRKSKPWLIEGHKQEFSMFL